MRLAQRTVCTLLTDILFPGSGIKVVPAGVLEIMQKSQAGWFHIRP